MYIRPEISESLTLNFAEAMAKRRAKGLPVYSLGLGEPDFDVPKEIIQSTINVLNTKRIGYSEPLGIKSLRDKVSQKFRTENKIPAGADNILITAGAKQALQMALMALIEPGDEVVIINPSYVSFIPQIYISEPKAKIKQIDVERDDFKLSIDKFKEAVSPNTKVVIINTPNNPAGYVFDNNTLEHIYNLAEEYDFFIVSDEVYEKLVFSPVQHLSIGSFEKDINRVFTINGFSKSHAMSGWRLGYLCFPSNYYKKILKLQQHINTNTCTFIQLGIEGAFDIDYSYLIEYREKLKYRLTRIDSLISELSKVTLVQPVSGLFAFINISNTRLDSNTFCSRLLEDTGVAVYPGIAFGKNWYDHLRLSFGVQDDLLEKGLELIKSFIESL